MVNKDASIIMLAGIAAIAGLLFGFDTGIISGALPYIQEDFGLTSDNHVISELIVSAVPFGALVGACFSSFLSNRLGRKGSIIFTAVLFTLGTLFLVVSSYLQMIVIGRFILGYSIGVSAMVVPMYLSEISPPKLRGTVVFLFQLAITLGLLSAFIANYWFSDSGNWQAMFLMGLIPAILLGLGTSFLPRSPRWLLLQNRDEEARAVLSRLRGHDNNETEIEDIKENLSSMRRSNIKMLFTRPIFPLVALSFGLFAFQQLTGINTIFYYAPQVLVDAGFHNVKVSIAASILVALANVLATIVGVWVIDKVGRRKLLHFGYIGMIVCLLMLSMNYHQMFGGTQNPYLALSLLIGMIVCFAVSLGGLPYIIMSEIFPLHIRHYSMAVASTANWGFNMLVSATFLSLINSLGIANTYLLYGICTIIGYIICIFTLPETKGISLEQIEKNIQTGKPLRLLGQNSG